MAKWSGKTRGGTFGYSFFIFLIKHTNRKVTYSFMRIVAFYFFLFSRSKAIMFYFQTIHGLTGNQLKAAIYKNYVLLGEIIVDKISFMVKPNTKFTFNYEGEDYLRQMAASGKGGMLIGAHMGNWELAGNLLDRIDVKVNIVLMDVEHEKIKALLEKNNIVRKFNVIPIKDDFSHLSKIKEAFANNEFVVMHGDRFVEGNGVSTANFLGRKATFPTGPLYIASKFGAPVSFVYTLKEKATHYHFYATEPKIFEYPSNLKTRKDDIAKMVEAYVSNLEVIVRKYPTQWFNYFPFWEEEKI
jgi:predicted LPLAT superfamily acyltransferase